MVRKRVLAEPLDPKRVLAENIRRVAGKNGGLEHLRAKSKLSNGTFYGLLSDAPREPSRPTLRKLRDAGVTIPADFLRL